MISRHLETHLTRQDWTLRRKFARLDAGQRAAVDEAFTRHRLACERVGCKIDPHFLSEVIHDAAKMATI
jgi:hypothetical protein